MGPTDDQVLYHSSGGPIEEPRCRAGDEETERGEHRLLPLGTPAAPGRLIDDFLRAPSSPGRVPDSSVDLHRNGTRAGASVRERAF